MKSIKRFFRGFKEGFQVFGHVVAGTVNFVLLLVIYVFGIGVTSVIAKATGKRFMDTKNTVKETYYISRKIEKEKLENYFRQF